MLSHRSARVTESMKHLSFVPMLSIPGVSSPEEDEYVESLHSIEREQ